MARRNDRDIIVRRAINADEFYDITSLDMVDIVVDRIEFFLSEIAGIALVQRRENDPHVCFVMLVQDDGKWSTLSDYLSGYWLREYIVVLQAALDWCEVNCIEIPHGWEFIPKPKNGYDP